jgi:hypothetical protein
MPECNSEAVVQQLETIVTLRNLRKQVETGKTTLPVSVDIIDAEIENQRTQMEETISQCGSLEGIPEEAISELSGGYEPGSELVANWENSNLEPRTEPELEVEPIAQELGVEV